jgi:hypothetical protein
MGKDVWIGALLSIPIGIITGLLVAPIQRWYQSRGETREVARAKRLKSEYDEIIFYARHPHKFTHFLGKTLITLIMSVTIWLVGSSMLVMIIQVKVDDHITKTAATAFNRYFLSGEMILNAIFVIAAMAWFIQVSSRFWKTWIRVAHFESYVLTVPREMRNFALERIAEHLANGDDDAFR